MPAVQRSELPEHQFVEVALPLPMRQTFTYELPPGYRKMISCGARVLVPFGSRTLTGYAVALSPDLPAEASIERENIKRVTEVIDETPLLTAEILELTKWAADYYSASWGEMLKASLPSGINSATERIISITEKGRSILLRTTNLKPLPARLLHRLAESGNMRQDELEKEHDAAAVKRVIRTLAREGSIVVAHRSVAGKVKPKFRKAVRLLANSSGIDGERPLTIPQQAVLNTLTENSGEMLFTELAESSSSGASVINTLVRRGVVEITKKEIVRDPFSSESLLAIVELELNSDQQKVLSGVVSALDAGEYKAFLLHGVTGSGKTEIYIRAMRAALDNGKTALMLVPEIALTPIFSQRLRAVFGSEVAILHSNLSAGERFDEWRRIRDGRARIAIGTRSAVFAPLSNLGLVIVDEEHDASYRQQESPFYNGRDVAVMSANQTGAVVVLGSATPALETYFNAQNGKYTYLSLAARVGGRPMAEAQLIDMREVFRTAGKDVSISPILADAIRETHTRGEQSIILLNRRGFSSFVLCRSCGESLRCRNCDITLTYHKFDRRLTCHYCGYSVEVPKLCPFCESEYLYFIGEGTEQLEQKLRSGFEDIRIARVDRDSMSRRGEMSRTLNAFDRGEIDMLIGTQMLAKGHDFHNVTLVGIISVDTGLGLPDFRSAERTFQLITQAAGRAGRGELQGRVMIQTYYPDHYALKFAGLQDYDGFYAEEIKFRNRMAYPPFVVLASIMIKHADESYARRNADTLKSALTASNIDNSCRILGVAPASLAKLKGEYRFQILIKSTNRHRMRDLINIGTARAEASGCDPRTVFVEIDPLNLM
ncbi:MAG: primosomal protein N' [Acidobacteriota bacterium]